MPRTSNKREQLVQSARDLIHQQGYRHTTLADIAAHSAVPLGNVYYYFKTKDDIARAVINEHRASFADLFDRLDTDIAEPRGRLHALLDVIDAMKNVTSESGCPIGSLCLELNKTDGPLANAAGEIVRDQLDWVAQQFVALNYDAERAGSLATELISQLQGLSLLSNALHDPALITAQLQRLHRWLDTV
ncbi:MAG: TetR/AcrR family transcriptional regulator [Proteobacteria bacterium]|jgi:TetR/AcrR family transcriptional regulator, transcriptional repressor for nem operon|nr:TetR/AcrR family transcriptional regulator [Pseudomonadota bacterium]